MNVKSWIVVSMVALVACGDTTDTGSGSDTDESTCVDADGCDESDVGSSEDDSTGDEQDSGDGEITGGVETPTDGDALGTCPEVAEGNQGGVGYRHYSSGWLAGISG